MTSGGIQWSVQARIDERRPTTRLRRPVTRIGMIALALGALALGYWSHSRPQAPSATLGYDAVFSATTTALLDPSLRSQGEALTDVFATASRRDLDAITRAFEQTHSGSGPGRLAAELLGELWARHDPESALARSESWEPYWRKQFVLPLMNAWARRDGATARQHISTLGGEKLRNSAERVVARGLFDARGEAGWDAYWADWPFGRPILRELLEHVARKEGLAGLIERVENLPDTAPEEFRTRAIQGVARLGGRIDPIRTTRFVEAHLNSPIAGVRGLRTPFVDVWAQSEPRAALDWLLTQPPDELRDAAMRSGYRRWAHDSSAIGGPVDWFESQTENVQAPLFDLYARALVRVDGERAIAVAKRIEGPSRERVLKRIERMVRARSGTRTPLPEAAPTRSPDDAGDDASRTAPRRETP